MVDLFAPAAPEAPLADRLRPQTLSDVVGQDHLLGPDAPLAAMVAKGKLPNLIFWGPPGTGKTSTARLLAEACGYRFVGVSAVMTSTAELKSIFAAAKVAGQRTLLFVDEIHRFNRSQQDAFLAPMEDGTVTLIGATTENPSFELNAAVLSRSQVQVLKRLDEAALNTLLQRAERLVGHPMPLDDDARQALIASADGDGRFLLGQAETLLSLDFAQPLNRQQLANTLHRRMPVYDKDRDGHYDLLSCFHKSLRGSDVDAAMYWAARMVEGGEAPSTIFRRLQCAASEDVGMADPQAMVQVLSAWQAFERVGWPEGRLFMAQAIAYVATAPKSNAAYLAFDQALALARKTGSLPPPKHILNAPTALMKDLGYHEGYQYDHDHTDAFSGQEFYPDAISQQKPKPLYQPNERGFERDIKRRLTFWASRRKSGR